MFDIYCANCIGRENNCLYPNRVSVTDEKTLAWAVERDYVCALYRDHYRCNANFLSSNCLALERIELPEELENVGSDAFENCVKLDLPDLSDLYEESNFDRIGV